MKWIDGLILYIGGTALFLTVAHGASPGIVPATVAMNTALCCSVIAEDPNIIPSSAMMAISLCIMGAGAAILMFSSILKKDPHGGLAAMYAFFLATATWGWIN